MPTDLFANIAFKGSALLTHTILDRLKTSIDHNTAKGAREFSDWLSKIGRQAIKMYPNSVSLRKQVTAVVYYVKRIVKSDSDIKEIRNKTMHRIDELMEQTANAHQKISEAGAKIILNQHKVLTLSYSTVVKNILLKAHRGKRKFTVYCCESRPLYEGRQFAEELANEGIQCVLIADAAVIKTLRVINLVISGADRICEESFVNKIGTLAVAAGATALKIPFYIAAETNKILKDTEFAVRFYPGNPAEVYDGKVKQLNAENYYFESIPLEYVSKIICEEGIFDTQEFKKWYLEA